ncbi:MFS transporter [Pseudonocardia asaccharolytica]|uniref:MFS transporter n=1 Tax=Pseudonocardia asaccharolytica DSM 44247 = NBRC 16224 TaxID=1123024 RepID=A0A511D1L1_9PSEU|nr:MFS transporter [Pseudonocardia asaccharolytica]GEL18689.1 MFS transporter [Pseudonocardia asaccharolytica DSM 44247 = NBRC 16224]
MTARTYLLAGGAFAVGTSAYIVSGVLPEVSSELDVSVGTAGQLVTAFAIAYAIGAPLLAAVTGRWERRRLLVAALLVAALGNALAALAPTFPLLVGTRVLSALGAAVYTPAATLVATQLSPPQRRGRAVAIVFGGLTFALVLGVPTGNLLGGVLGYRGVFALVAVASLMAAVAVRLAVPRVAAPPVVGLRARFAVAADRKVLTVLSMSVLGVLAAMTVFTYIAPLLAAATHVHGAVVSVLLLVYGMGAMVGNALGGRLADRFGSRRPLRLSFVLFVLVVATLPLTLTTVPGAAVALFVWGGITWSVNPPIQSWLIELAPAGSGLLLSLNASAIYLGAGLSGVFGAIVIDTAGVLALPPVAAAVGVVAVVLLLRASRRGPTDRATPVAPQPAGVASAE